MIEYQYCYTQNNNDAPICQACGGPFDKDALQGILLLDGITEEEWEKALRIWVPLPSEFGKFVDVSVVE